MAPLLLLLLLQAAASTTFPSCLTANTTWDSSLITSLTPNIPTPELCQQICVDSPPCEAVTWASSDASPFPLSCSTFSSTISKFPCTNCVSGPSSCSCSSQGECQAEDGNIVDHVSDIPTEQECAALCLENSLCQFFTYFGDASGLRHFCILFSSCDTIVTSCSDCHTSPANCQVCSFEDTLPDGSCATDQQTTGLLVVGGAGASTSVELWSPGTSCSLPSLPSDMPWGPTVDLLHGLPVACYSTSCYQLTEAGWLHYQDTLHTRQHHTSAVLEEGLLLVGGNSSPSTTELLPVGGGEAREGFSLKPGRKDHCSIQVASTTIVLSGGSTTRTLVSDYSNLNGEVSTRQLPDHITGRYHHACSFYLMGQSQVLIVTGGRTGSLYLASTELLDYSAPAGGWREAGQLPSPRQGLRAARLGRLVHVSGGYDGSYMDSILSWSPDTESWDQAGVLTAARNFHGVTEVSLAAVEDYCTVL